MRWQLGNVLYYAAVEEPAGGGQPTYFAGPVQTVDLCSVSACDPHYFTYPAPPAGGTAVTGAKSGGASGPTTYDIAVPLSVVGQATADSLLEEVTGLVTVSPTPASVPLTAVQAAADVVPIQIEGTRTFNFRAASLASAAPAPAPAPVAAPNGSLPRTGPDSSAGLMAGAGVVMVGLALGSRRLFARTRATMRN